MDPEAKLALLSEWSAIGKTQMDVDRKARELVGYHPECRLARQAATIFNAYTATLRILLGDKNHNWLDWFAWENDFGLKAHPAGIDGISKPIKTPADLLEIITLTS